MNKGLKIFLQLFGGLTLAAILLYVTYRNQDIDQLKADIMATDVTWLVISSLLLVVAHFFRSLRWKLMLESAEEKVSLVNTFLSVLICFGVNAVTPKLGELARCSLLYKSDDVPPSKSLGTVVTERIIDLIVLLLGIAFIMVLEYSKIVAVFDELSVGVLGEAGKGKGTVALLGFIGILTVIGITFLVFVRRLPDKGVIGMAKRFVLDTEKAARSIFSLKSPLLFILYTAGMWFFLILMNWAYIKAMPGMDSLNVGFYFAGVILFIGGLGWALPIPNGMGSHHLLIKTLFTAFGYGALLGATFAAVANGTTLISTVSVGLIAWLIFLALNTIRERKQQANAKSGE